VLLEKRLLCGDAHSDTSLARDSLPYKRRQNRLQMAGNSVFMREQE
jgi:hypothetical protein